MVELKHRQRQVYTASAAAIRTRGPAHAVISPAATKLHKTSSPHMNDLIDQMRQQMSQARGMPQSRAERDLRAWQERGVENISAETASQIDKRKQLRADILEALS